MPLIILVWGIFYISLGNIITANEGLGHDGKRYAVFVKNFYGYTFIDKELIFYFTARILPSLLINFVLTIFNIAKDNYNIIKSFQILNLILLILSSYLWVKISTFYQLHKRLVWLGFFLGFLNYAITTYSFFNPVLTDISAFFLGFCLIYAFIKNKLKWLIVTTFFGSFVWPTLIYAGILMILFPINSWKNFEIPNTSKKLFLSFLVPIPFLINGLYCIYQYIIQSSSDLPWYAWQGYPKPFIIIMLLIGVIGNYMILLYFGSIMFPRESIGNFLKLIVNIIKQINPKNFIISVLLFSVVYVIRLLLTTNDSPMVMSDRFLYNLSYLSALIPFYYIKNHILYFGPCFLFLYLCLKFYKPQVMTFGFPGYIIFIIVFILLFIPESRLVINFFPFILLWTVLVMKDLNISRSAFLDILILCLIFSNVYVSLGRILIRIVS